jgi:hypothetical protein
MCNVRSNVCKQADFLFKNLWKALNLFSKNRPLADPADISEHGWLTERLTVTYCNNVRYQGLMATSLKMTAVWDTPPPSSAWPQTTVACVLKEYDTICNHPSYYTREWDLALGLISHETNLIWWLADICNSYRRQITNIPEVGNLHTRTDRSLPH